MKKLFVILSLASLLSCSTLNDWEKSQDLLSRIPKPSVVVSVNAESILIRDMKGHYWTISDLSFASLKPGDILR
jgi:hypothetical protein